MFGRKLTAPLSSPPQSPPAALPADLALQVLTARYIIDGFLPAMETRLVGFLNIPTQITITLKDAKLTVLGAQAINVRETLPLVVIPKSAIFVFIPRDEAGVHSASLQMPERAERALIHVGPFFIRGDFRLPGGMPLENFFNAGGGDMAVVTDAEVKCQLLGARFADLKAAILVLNKTLVQLYHPEPAGLTSG